MAEAQRPRRVFLDTNLLYPPILRGFLLSLADRGLFEPMWSAGVLREWAHLIARHAGAERESFPELLARMEARWPQSLVPAGEPDLLDLPDRNDAHVLAAAIAGGAELLLTRNLRDFPQRHLREHGIALSNADDFVLALWLDAPEPVESVVAALWPDLQGRDLRNALRRATLPRLGKALEAARAA